MKIISSKLIQPKLLMIGAALLLLIQLVVQLGLAHTDSATTDEGVHLSAGYTYITRRDFRFNPEHPPLVKMLAALPLLAQHPHLPDQTNWNAAQNYFYDSWAENRAYGDQFLYGVGNNADNLLFWARVPMVLLTLLLGLLIWLIAFNLAGPLAALVAVGLYTFDPLVAAHGHLVTTDIGAALGVLASVWVLWCYLKSPSKKQVILLGLALGLALLTKFTTILLLPICIILAVSYISLKQQWRARGWTIFGHAVVVGLIAWLVIWAGYLFTTTPAPAQKSFVTSYIQINHHPTPSALTTAEKLLDSAYTDARFAIIPREYFKGLFLLLNHVGGGHQSFLLGSISNTGWWYYFPVVFATKTPLLELMLFGAAIWYFWRRPLKNAAPFLIVAGLLFFASSLLSKANLGVRHLLPVFPLLYIPTAVFAVSSRRRKMVSGVLLLLLAINFFAAAPYYMAYYNRIAGGTRHGYMVARDSNYDWGQDLHRLQRYLKDHSLGTPYIIDGLHPEIVYDYYAIPHRPLSQSTYNKTGYVIMSASSLHNPTYQWVQSYPFVGRITPSLFIYHLDAL